MRDPSRTRVTGPLAPYAAGLTEALACHGYTPNSAALQMQLVAHLSRWLAAKGRGVDGLDAATIERHFAARRSEGRVNHRSARSAGPLIGHLRELGAVPAAPPVAAEGPVGELTRRYRRHLISERGLAAGTAAGYVAMVGPFLRSRERGGEVDLGGLTAAEVVGFVLAEAPVRSVGSAKLMVCALRSLLRFAHLEGLTASSLAGAVPSVASTRLAGLPKALGRGEVARMLASCDPKVAPGGRDLAILALLARLGLRKSEVAALTLDDVDWRSGEIAVRGKGGSRERMPLPADVGAVLAAYLRDSRPPSAEGRALFTRHKAPHTQITPGAVGHVALAAAGRAGLGRVSAHRLRHTAATETLRAGAALPEVARLLRHRSPQTTAIYAKVDREALREIARPWPTGSAS